MKKIMIVSRILKDMVITFLLIYFCIKTVSGKVILLPFIVCSIMVLLRDVFLLFNRGKYVEIFEKVFLISFLVFFIGVLILWCYISIVNGEYSLLIFSIPFWLVIIFMIRDCLGKNIKWGKNVKLVVNFEVVIPCFLVGVAFVSGVLMLIFGIKDMYKLNKNTKDFIIINAYYKDYEVYGSDNGKTTYRLEYVYVVNDVEYEVLTDYGTSYIPDVNSIRRVKYNPDNPKEAFLLGLNGKKGLIYMGLFFLLGSITFILTGMMELGLFDKFKVDIVGAYVGGAFLIIGIGTIVLQYSEWLSLVITIKSMGLWILIPIMFILFGGCQMIKCLVLGKKRG